jgi:putative transposase
MGIHNTKSDALHSTACSSDQLFEDWFDPIEMGVRARVRSFIEELIEAELEEALSRPRYGRTARSGAGAGDVAPGSSGHGHGRRQQRNAGAELPR